MTVPEKRSFLVEKCVLDLLAWKEISLELFTIPFQSYMAH